MANSSWRCAPRCDLKGSLEEAGSALYLRPNAGLDQGQVRRLERREPLARGGIQREMTADKTRYTAWRSGPDAELHVIVYDEAELPLGTSSLGPWLGSKEGEVANLKPHYRAMLEDTGFEGRGGVQDGGVINGRRNREAEEDRGRAT